MEAEEGNQTTTAKQGGTITLATIDTDYIKGPITVTSMSQDEMVVQEPEQIIQTVEDEDREEREESTKLAPGDKEFDPKEAGEDEDDDDEEEEDYKEVKAKKIKREVKKKGPRKYIQNGAELSGEDDAEPEAGPEKRRKERERASQRKSFRSDWLRHPDFKDWLVRVKGSDDRAYCTACNKELCSGKSELVKHNKGKKHKKKLEMMGLRHKGSSSPIKNDSEFTIKGLDPDRSIVGPDVESSEFSTVLDENGVSHVLHIVDMRSDTVTQPNREMKYAMTTATLGDDAFSEDPTVKTLEVKVANLLEKESALFVPSGTMANLLCVMTHCWNRGSEFIVGDKSNLHMAAQSGMAQIAGVHHRIIRNKPDGTFSLDEIQSIASENEEQWSNQILVCIENTHNQMGGKALPVTWIEELGTLCSQHGLMLHCDGARLMNGAVALGIKPARLVQACDSVTLCLNKGLGCPMGSVIAGTKDFITRATRIRKLLGGGMHQGGMMAAAGLYALDNQVSRLSADHANARAIAQCVHVEHSSAITVDLQSVHTNIVLLQCDNIRVDAKKLCQRLASVTDAESDELGGQVVVMMIPVSDTTVRFMTHCDVRKEDVKAVIKKLRYVIQEYDNMMYLEYKMAVE